MGAHTRPKKLRKCSDSNHQFMRYVPLYSDNAIEELGQIEARDARKILNKIDAYCDSPDPLRFAKRLSGPLSEYFRYRVGDFRVIFRLARDGGVVIIHVLQVVHRRDAYRRCVAAENIKGIRHCRSKRWSRAPFGCLGT